MSNGREKAPFSRRDTDLRDYISAREKEVFILKKSRTDSATCESVRADDYPND